MTFATATPSTSSSTAADRITGDALSLIDLRLLSRSELLALSLSTARSKDNNPIAADDDEHLVNPKIDRSVFNESAGSRKQTFSRLRLAPRQAAAAAAAAAALAPPSLPQIPIEEEDSRVISLLRRLFQGEGHCTGGLEEKSEEDMKLVGVPIKYSEDVAGVGTGGASLAVEVVEGKRKRGRPRKIARNDNHQNPGAGTGDFVAEVNMEWQKPC